MLGIVIPSLDTESMPLNVPPIREELRYPMIEARKHFSNLPDAGYLSRCASVDSVRSYK